MVIQEKSYEEEGKMKETMKKRTSFMEEEKEEEATRKKMKRPAYDPEDPRLFDKIFSRMYEEEKQEFLKFPVEERRRMVKERREELEKFVQWNPANMAAGIHIADAGIHIYYGEERLVLTPEQKEVQSTSFRQYADTFRISKAAQAEFNAIRGNPDEASSVETEAPEVWGAAGVNWLDLLDLGNEDAC